MEENKVIYLDYAATTPIDARVLSKMLPYLQQDGHYGNPASSTHVYGWKAKEAVEKSRRQIAKLLGANNKEIIFTSGATESDNLAIIGAAKAYANKGKHIITSQTEHKAVLDSCRYLESRGYDITYLKPQSNGLIRLSDIEQAIRPETTLISLMHVNNETGVLQDIAQIGQLTRKHNIVFHVDGAQSVGKMKLDLSAQYSGVDLLSISGHKIYGPKGIGALFIRRNPKINLLPQMHGGGHEFGFRSGTLPTHQIVGLAAALKYSLEDLEDETVRLKKLEEKLLFELNRLGGIILNGDENARKPGHINISVTGIEGESLIGSLNEVALSSGSACNSAVAATSHVLKAMGVSDQLAHSALRISLGRFTTEFDIDKAANHLTTIINKLRSISPVYKTAVSNE